MLSYSNHGAQVNHYKQQNAMISSPGELTLMLYDAAIRNIKLAKVALEDKDIMKSSNNIIKTERIIDELMNSLDMRYELSDNLFNLYVFINRELASANIQKNSAKLDVVLELITDLRNTWQQAIKLNRQQVLGQGCI